MVPRSSSAVAALHAQELQLFRKEIRRLAPLLVEHRDSRVRFGGTITVGSGRAVAMAAPIEPLRPRDLARDGGLFGVLWLTPGARERRERRLRAGTYALRLVRERRRTVVEFVAPNGQVAHVTRAIPQLLGTRGDVEDEIKEKLKKLDIDIKVLDIEILFGGGKDEPSEVRGSILFWSFHLFDDP